MGISPSGLAGAAGAAQGLLDGYKLYLQTENMQQDQAIKKRLANAQSIDAAAKLYDALTPTQANQYLKNAGLPTFEEPSSSQGLIPSPQGQEGSGLLPNSPGPSPAPTETPQSPDQSAQMGGGLMPQASNLTGKQLKQLNFQAVDPKYQAETRNAQLEQFNKGQADFKGQKETFGTAADAYGKLMKVTGDKSPKNLQSALMQVIKLDMPRQAVRMGSLQAMEEDPAIMQRWGNDIAKAKSGMPSDLSVQDLQRVGTNLYQSNSDEFRAAQGDERKVAQVRGADPSYTDLSYADQMDALAKNTKKNMPAYQTPGVENLAQQMGPSAVTAYQGLKGIGKRLGFLGDEGEQSQINVASLKPPTSDQIKILKDALAKNPKDPRASQMKMLIERHKQSQEE